MIKVKSFAKLNLGLHIIPKKTLNGFFPIHFINCQINICDEILFENAIEIIFKCNDLKDPKGSSNLIIKAFYLLRNYSKNNKFGAKIILNKKIPITSGFGGGSSNAAITLKALSKLWNLKISNKKYFEFADKLGRDVFYNLIGGLCEVKGDGNIVKKLNFNLPRLWLVIIIPNQVKSSTEYMYKNIDLEKVGENMDKITKLKTAIKNKNIEEIFKNLHNDFEFSVEKLFPIVVKIKDDLLLNNAKKTLLAGSGLSVVGFYKSKIDAKKAYDKLKNVYNNILLTYTL